MTASSPVSGEFREVTIGALMAEFHDGPHATPKPAREGPIFLGIKNISADGRLDLSTVRHIDESDFGRWTRRVTPRAGDIVFTYEATLHRYALIPPGFRGCLGRRLALIRPRLDLVDVRFLHLALRGPEWRRTVEDRVITGATVDRVPLLDFPSFPLSIPPLEVQRRIASVLGCFDDLIEINKRRIELLEQLARSLYREWFVRFRFPGHSEVNLSKSLLGRIPEQWGVTRLRDIATLRYGKSLPAGKRRPGPYAVVSSAGVVGQHDEAIVRAPGIVVGRKGNIGSVWWIDRDFFPIDTTYWVDTEVPLGLIYWQLQDLAFIDSHAAVPGLSREQAGSLLLLDVDRSLAEQFDSIHRVNFDALTALRAQNRQLAATRDLLLPRLVTGALDISDIDLGDVLPAEAA